MKRRFISILCILSIIAIGSFCYISRIQAEGKTDDVNNSANSVINTSNVTASDSTSALDRQPYVNDNSKVDREDYITKIKKDKLTDETKKVNSIPVFKEKSLFFDTDGLYYLGRDASYYANQNSRQNFTGSILAAYPTLAIRETSDGVYFVYDTDTGDRMFLYFNEYNTMSTPIGFPVVIKELLPYESFRDLKIGDSIQEVEAIDSVASLYEKQFKDIWHIVPVAAETLAKRGYPCTSIHYLSDGILKIEYGMSDDKFVISDIEYRENYILEGSNGKAVNYKINDNDLPSGK